MTKTTIKRRGAKSIPDPSVRQYDAMKRLFRAAVGAFVEKLAFDLSQHIDTGMTISSTLALAGKVRHKTIISSYIQGYGPKKKGHQSVYSAPGSFSDNIADWKSRTLGKSLGRKAYNLEMGDVNNPKMHFEFQIVVLQHLFNSDNWEWGTIEDAHRDMVTFIEANWTDYILDIDEWLVNGRIGFRK